MLDISGGRGKVSGSFDDRTYDFIIVGAGISGSFIADELCRAGLKCLMLEAGKFFTRQTYPRLEVDGTSQLYWSGGLELNHDAKVVLLRPKAVGGGSIVNQALVDRFDDDALDSWREVSGVDFFNVEAMAEWYERAESELAIQYIPEEHRNRNALIFKEGFEKLGYRWAPLRRAQKDCRYEDGNDCIECLNGCRIGSKQSMPETVLKKALAAGLTLVPEFEVVQIVDTGDGVTVHGLDRCRRPSAYRAEKLVMAAGAIGNSKLLLSSGFGKKLPALGRNFYCHPQYNNFAIYEDEVNSHKGPFQALKSDDPGFRSAGFKLENVYAGPAAVAMLISGFGKAHHALMEQMNHFACIEVCTRDTNPGRIKVNSKGKVTVFKKLNARDKKQVEDGVKVINDIFRATGAKKIINCPAAIGLHLMGGLGLGVDPARSVVGPDFRLHGYKHIFAADCSIFPNAPGINPSLTIMALSKKAAAEILGSSR